MAGRGEGLSGNPIYLGGASGRDEEHSHAFLLDGEWGRAMGSWPRVGFSEDPAPAYTEQSLG